MLACFLLVAATAIQATHGLNALDDLRAMGRKTVVVVPRAPTGRESTAITDAGEMAPETVGGNLRDIANNVVASEATIGPQGEVKGAARSLPLPDEAYDDLDAVASNLSTRNLSDANSWRDLAKNVSSEDLTDLVPTMGGGLFSSMNLSDPIANRTETTLPEPTLPLDALVFTVLFLAALLASNFYLDTDSKSDDGLLETTATARSSPSRFVRYWPALAACTFITLILGHCCTLFRMSLTMSASTIHGEGLPYLDLNILSFLRRSFSGHAWPLFIGIGLAASLLPLCGLLGVAIVTRGVDSGKLSKEAGHCMISVPFYMSKWNFLLPFICSFIAMILDYDAPETELGLTAASGMRLNMASFTMHIFVKLMYGFTFYLVSVAGSTFMTYLAMLEFSPPEDKGKKTLQTDAGEPQTLSATADPDVDGYVSHRVKVALFVSVTAIIFMLAAVVVPMFHVRHEGFVGKLLKEREDMEISVLTMVFATRSDPLLAQQAQLAICVMTVVILTCAVPFLELSMLSVSIATSQMKTCCSEQCFTRLSRWCRKWAQFLYAFDCVEVYFVAGAILYFDLSRFVASAVEDDCERTGGFYSNNFTMTSIGLDFAVSDECVRISSVAGIGSIVVLVAVALRSAAWQLSNGLSAKD